MAEKITQIRIKGNGYHGKSVKNVFLPAGVYDADDPLLNSQAEYLVENGHAEAIKTVEAPSAKKAKKKKVVDHQAGVIRDKDEVKS